MTEWPARTRPTVEAALRDTGSADPESRLTAVEALASVGEEHRARARAALAGALADPVPRVRAAAALALAELGPCDEACLDQLLELADEPDGRVAQAAVIALGESGAARALPAVIRALGSLDPDVRFQAVLAVARLGGPDALEPLAEAASDEDPEVRANVAAALADLDQEAGNPVLVRLLGDSDGAVRLEAALALAPRGDRRATVALIESLDDAEAAPQAVRALGQLRDPEAAAPLRRLCTSWTTRAPLRAAAAAVLAALDDPAGWKELDRWLRSRRRREARAMAVFAAGELGLSGVVDQLCRMLGDPGLADRDGVARSLGQIGDPRARPALDLALSDPDPDVALEARLALEALAARA